MASEQRMKKQVTVVVASGQCQDTNNNKDPSHSLQRDLLPTAAAFTQSVGKLLFPPLPPLSHYFPHFLPIHPLSPSSPIPRSPPPLCVSCCKQFSTTSILVTLTNTRCLLNISSFINLLGSLSQHLLFLFIFAFPLFPPRPDLRGLRFVCQRLPAIRQMEQAVRSPLTTFLREDVQLCHHGHQNHHQHSRARI